MKTYNVQIERVVGPDSAWKTKIEVIKIKIKATDDTSLWLVGELGRQKAFKKWKRSWVKSVQEV